MTNNDVLKRLRYSFDFSDQEMMDIFKLAGENVTRESICDWLKKDDDESFKKLIDKELATFLNGFIILKRGKQDGSPKPVAEDKLTNNIILRKIKIALNLQAEDIIELLASQGSNISKHEVSAFFRKPDHDKYKYCNDQYLRHLLNAIQKKYAGE